ncbi:MAG: small subunit ribosomal protein S2, partial [Paraglaciecola sp.]
VQLYLNTAADAVIEGREKNIEMQAEEGEFVEAAE